MKHQPRGIIGVAVPLRGGGGYNDNNIQTLGGHHERM